MTLICHSKIKYNLKETKTITRNHLNLILFLVDLSIKVSSDFKTVQFYVNGDLFFVSVFFVLLLNHVNNYFSKKSKKNLMNDIYSI